MALFCISLDTTKTYKELLKQMEFCICSTLHVEA